MTNNSTIRRCKCLAEKECANYKDHICLTEDRPCYLVHPTIESIHDGAINCDYFFENVLGIDKELSRLVWQELRNEGTEGNTAGKDCECCGKTFVPSSPRQKYCASCRETIRKKQNLEKQRRHNDRLRNERYKGET